MNNIEREQIIALRAAGQSYARIAEALELSVNSVKSFCRRNALSSGACPACQTGQEIQCLRSIVFRILFIGIQ